MTTKKLTDKQKDKLKNSKFVRSNSDDITVNPSFKEDIEYDEEDGTLSYDRRTKEGKEIERILNSRNRKSKSDEGDYCDEENESKSEYNDKEELNKRIEELDKRIYEIASSNDDELRRLYKEQSELEMKLEDMSKTPRERELEKQLDLLVVKLDDNIGDDRKTAKIHKEMDKIYDELEQIVVNKKSGEN